MVEISDAPWLLSFVSYQKCTSLKDSCTKAWTLQHHMGQLSHKQLKKRAITIRTLNSALKHFNSFSCCKSLLVTADNYYDHNTEIIHIQFWFQFQLFLLRFSQFSLIHVFLLLSAPEPNAFKILLVQFYLTVQNQ